MTEASPDTSDLKLAEELASRVGRAQGSALLDLAKAHILLANNKPGTQTSEFKLSALLIAAGVVMVILGALKNNPALQTEGIDLAKFVGVGYAASRGLAKLGIKEKTQ